MDFSEYKKFYKSIGTVRCPYFGYEEVVFNKKGFDHLLSKRGVKRTFYDQLRRLKLLIYCKRILEGEHLSVNKTVIYEGKEPAQFWAFEACINNIKMRLLVRKVGTGMKHFFDIFPLKH